MNNPSSKSALSAASVTALVGGILIVIALIGLASSNWSSLGSMGRVLITAIPTIALFLAGFSKNKFSHAAEVKTISIFTAVAATPFAVGIFTYEYFFSDVRGGSSDATLIALGVAIAVAALVESTRRIPAVTILTIGYTGIWLSYLSDYLDDVPYLACILVFGLLAAYASGQTYLKKDGRWAQFYVVFSLLLITIGLVSFPHAFAQWYDQYFDLVPDSLYSKSYYSYIYLSSAGEYVKVVASAVLALLPIGAGVILQRYHKQTSEYGFALGRRYAELFAGISLIILPAYAALIDFSDSDLISVVALAFSLLALFVSYRVALWGWRMMAATTSGILLLALLIKTLSAIDISFPLVLLGVGIILFVFAFFMGKDASSKYIDALKKEAGTWEGLGEPMPEAPKQRASETPNEAGIVFKHEKPQATSPVVVVLLIILGLWLFTLITQLVSGSSF